MLPPRKQHTANSRAEGHHVLENGLEKSCARYCQRFAVFRVCESRSRSASNASPTIREIRGSVNRLSSSASGSAAWTTSYLSKCWPHRQDQRKRLRDQRRLTARSCRDFIPFEVT